MSEEITLDKEVFKALAGETRVSVLKSLLERRKTQSELAKELNLAAPTIKDHVDILHKAGLVQEIDDGHKWKYIQLTVKGKSLLQPQDKRILVLLGSSLVGIAAAGFLAYNSFLNSVVSPPGQEMLSAMTMKTAEELAVEGAANGTIIAADQATPFMAERSADMAAQILPMLPMSELAILVVCLVVFGISVGMWIKQTY